MESKIGLGLGLTVALVFLVGLYWGIEGIKMQNFENKFYREALERGALEYAQFCVTCHGLKGGGRLEQPLFIGLPLNPSYRERPLDEETTIKTTARGRPAAGMPALGEEDGGPLKKQQVQEVATFITNWNGEALEKAIEVAKAKGSLPPIPTPAPTPPPAATPQERGRSTFMARGCGGCHTIQGIPGASGTVAPDLTRQGAKGQLAGVIPNTEDNLKRFLANPPSIKPGTLMPNLGLSQREIEDLTAFLLSLR